MELKDHFIHLFKYSDWANKEAANSITGAEEKDEKFEKLLSHIISAQQIWLNRILERVIYVDVWQKRTAQECISHSSTITTEWTNLLEGLHVKDFEKRVEYTTTKGEKHTNTIKDIITHVINHSTYHRAQIAQLVRQSGGEPAKTDYIVYQREIQKEREKI